MSYQKKVRRLTIPLETSEQIKNARDMFKAGYETFSKIYRSPNSERNKLHIAQYEVVSMNYTLKMKANKNDDYSNYKNAT